MSDRKFAFLLNAGPGETNPTLNALDYALDLHGADHEVAVYLDGPATDWPGECRSGEAGPVGGLLGMALDEGIVAGACGFCASNHEATTAIREVGIDLLGDGDTQGIDPAALADEGYELLFVG